MIKESTVKIVRPTFLLIIDFVLFFIFPLVFWELCREFVGDYPTMILCTLPGILYSLYRFNDTGKLNYTGIFVIMNLIAGLVVDFLSGSALQLLWNNVFYSTALLIIYFVSVAAKKPVYLYFALDLMGMKGYDRKITKELFFEKKTYKLFQLITLLYCANEVLYIACLSRWIMKYGVEAYKLDIILNSSLNIMLSGASLAFYFYIHQAVNEITPVRKMTIAKARRETSFPIERAYIYFSTLKR